jgi:hypothetical protein
MHCVVSHHHPTSGKMTRFGGSLRFGAMHWPMAEGSHLSVDFVITDQCKDPPLKYTTAGMNSRNILGRPQLQSGKILLICILEIRVWILPCNETIY